MTRVSAWEDDPRSDPSVQPIKRPVPVLRQRRLGVVVAGDPPSPGCYRRGTTAFRFWNAADSLTRSAQYWAALVPAPTRWQTGDVLPARLDAGNDLNAYYDRRGLHFFHAHVSGEVVYSGESPDVLCHELGHAVLDALVPAIWNAATIEAAALHESFGDISAMLSALELESVRTAVLEETAGRLSRSSRISRLAEQLGWAIRQSHPDAVDRDCLRNAANSFFYRAPERLPPLAPASVLSSHPHSFSRVFTAAWLDTLAGMVEASGGTGADLLRISRDAGAILVHAVQRAPIASNYFAQVAAQLLLADGELFHGRYREALRRAFVGRGVLSSSSLATMATGDEHPRWPAVALPDGPQTRWVSVPIEGSTYGLRIRQILVEAPHADAEMGVRSAAPDHGALSPVPSERASQAFVADLLRRDRIDPGDLAVAGRPRVRVARTTHALERQGKHVRLVRRLFH